MPSLVSAASLGLLTLASHVAAHPSTASAAGSAPAGHEFQAPGAGDVRSPCPGLNSLANHGQCRAKNTIESPTDVFQASFPDLEKG